MSSIALAEANDIMPTDCVIVPYKTVDLSSAVSGVVESVDVNRSDFVEQDQVVARLKADVEKASVALAQKRTEIEAEVKVGRINVDFDERERKRIDSLYAKKAVTFRHKEEADREAKLSEWELKQAQDLEEIRDLELKRAQALLDQKIIRSPIPGFIAKVFRNEGEYIEDQPILRVVQLDPLHVDTILPMKLFGKISKGMQAEVVPETDNQAIRIATVSSIDPLGDAASGTFGVRLELPNPNFDLPAGLKCGMRFVEASTSPEKELTNQSAPTQQPPASAITSADQKPAQSTITAMGNNVIRSLVPSAEAMPVPPTKLNKEASAEETKQLKTVQFGPIYSAERKTLLETALTNHQYDFSVIEKEQQRDLGFIVLTDGGSDFAESLERAEALREKGITDLQILTKGDFSGYISLGVAYEKSKGEEHIQMLADKGIDAFMKPRSKQQKAWWLNIKMDSDNIPQVFSELLGSTSP
ncbi:efflux RND transporter periplasmic adaptor subunit [Maricurvus nonylphenolicus]|uniref:efflux RND transporter periplasmic adaptor subunit n=1 Tax=Maricurvus nonylphenolicus TaxID=1008307 RepID=UPI0036F3DED1